MLSGVKVLRQQSSSRENLHHHNRINHLVQYSAASSIPQRLQTPSGGHHPELVPTSTSAPIAEVSSCSTSPLPGSRPLMIIFQSQPKI